MKIFIISDTHGNNINVIKVLSCINKKIDAIIHLGDYINDAKMISNCFSSIPIYSIAGNCDYSYLLMEEKIKQVLTLNGVRIFITHGHNYNVKEDYNNIYNAGKKENVSIILFGHTHIPVIEYKSSILLMNPGSISKPRENNIPTYGMLDISANGIIHPSIIGVFGDNDYRLIE